jgi:cysteine-rich repeat protein
MTESCRRWTFAVALLLVMSPPAAAQNVVTPTFVVRAPISPAYAGQPSVAANADGTFLVTWIELSGIEGDFHRIVFSQRFSAAGLPMGAPLVIDGADPSDQEVGADSAGGYLLAYRQAVAPSFDASFYGRRLDAAGAPLGAPFRIDDAGAPQAYVSVAALPNGAVFQWSPSGLHARLHDLFGAPRGASSPVAAQIYGYTHDVAALAGGGFVSVWSHFEGAIRGRFRLYDADGVPRGPAVPLAQAFAIEKVVAEASGGFAVIGANLYQVFAARFDANGQPRGAALLVFTEAAPWHPVPELAVDLQDNLYAVWSSWSDASSNRGPMRARAFDAANVPLGPAVTLIAEQTNIHVRTAALTNDTFVNVWNGDAGEILANVVSLCAAGTTTCGNGVLQTSCEQCDQGAANSDLVADACRTDCRAAGCGDGVVDTGEECDDGNRFSADGCDQSCVFEVCGNGRRETAELCDDGAFVDGDGCDSNCTPTACGNDIVTAGEECEDQNYANGDGCDQNCLIEECGNARREAGEECDDGNLVEGDECDSNCTLPACGNAVHAPFEECDDGNLEDGDGCDEECLIEICGNGRIEGLEQCDDDNVNDGDGCQADCTRTPIVDALLAPVRPLRVVLPASGAPAQRRVRLRVRHAGIGAVQAVRLIATDGSCPAGTVTAPPDVDRSQPGSQDVATLAPGGSATAALSLQFAPAAFTLTDREVPQRCAVSVAAVGVAGAFDVQSSNNAIAIVADVYAGGAVSAGVPEILLRPPSATAISIPDGSLGGERRVSARLFGTSLAGATLAVDDGNCPPGSVVVERPPNASGTARLLLRASRAFFTTTPKSPARCTALLTASSGGGDTEPSNDTAPLVIDVIDGNDF